MQQRKSLCASKLRYQNRSLIAAAASSSNNKKAEKRRKIQLRIMAILNQIALLVLKAKVMYQNHNVIWQEKSSCIALPKGAQCWKDPCPASTELLQPNASVRPFCYGKVHWADPEFYLRPKQVVFDAPKSRHRSIIHGVGTSSLGALEGLPTLTTCFKRHCSVRFRHGAAIKIMSLCGQKQHPPWLQGPDEEDAMSDTDSDEGLIQRQTGRLEGWPTIEESKTAFWKTSDKVLVILDAKENAASVDGLPVMRLYLPISCFRRHYNGIVVAAGATRKLRWDAIPKFVKTVDSIRPAPQVKADILSNAIQHCMENECLMFVIFFWLP